MSQKAKMTVTLAKAVIRCDTARNMLQFGRFSRVSFFLSPPHLSYFIFFFFSFLWVWGLGLPFLYGREEMATHLSLQVPSPGEADTT